METEKKAFTFGAKAAVAVILLWLVFLCACKGPVCVEGVPVIRGDKTPTHECK